MNKRKAIYMSTIEVNHQPLNTSIAKNAALWILQLGSSAMFFYAGFAKLTSNPYMVQTFEAIGAGQWFRYVTGGIEFLAAVLLLIPSLAGVGAALLVPTMIGAVLSHLLILGGSPALPATLLVAAAVIAYARREQIKNLF